MPGNLFCDISHREFQSERIVDQVNFEEWLTLPSSAVIEENVYK